MFRKLLVLAFGAALGLGGAPSASAAPVLQGAPALSAGITFVGHRHSQGNISRGYQRGDHTSRPRYRESRHYRPRYDYDRGYGGGYRGRYPSYGNQFIYRLGPAYNSRGNYGRSYGHSYGRSYGR